jgi:dihydrolipoamide dehydrogenase
MFEFKLPEVSDNISSGTIIKIFVSAGQTVKKNQPLVEFESEKASIEIPSSVEGTIKEILVKEGQQVKVGQVLLKIEGTSANATTAPSTAKQPVKETPQPAAISAPATAASLKSSPARDTDLVVIGGGPGGYTAAFLAGDLGMDVTLVDTEINPGGVCLYKGCIPSKALLHAARVVAETKEAKEFGLDFTPPKIDLNKLRDWKNSIVTKLTSGLGVLTKQRKIKHIQGRAVFLDSNTIEISKADGSKQKLTFDYAIVATGSSPVKLPIAPNSPRILDSTSALEIKSIPKSLLLVGAGYIGLELGTVYAELGSAVSVVEMLPGIIPGADRDLANVLAARLEKIFHSVMTSTKILKMEEKPAGILVHFEDAEGKKFSHEYENVLVAIGRRPNSGQLQLEKTNVKLDSKGFITVDAQRRSTDPSIYAIGDIAGNPMLAHKASHEGRVAVEAIAGHKVAFEPNCIPAVVFTDPEVAWCGLTETEAAQQNRKVQVMKFPWGASGRALSLGRTDGLTKLLIDPDTERLLGMAIVGVGAGELISEGVVAIEMGAVVADLKLCIHPHPTTSETIMESAEMFFGQSTHIYKPKRK